jgi:hypothetical protein
VLRNAGTHIFLASLIYNSFRLATGPMEVQIRTEVMLVELVDVFGVGSGDVSIAHVLADHGSILGFQAIVPA